ncbi:hypothetical protein BS78_08G128500 [Paspalum vaginatum]|nr:hypothetical protein BS78_08G128500 [Paspalum vaginatum]
MTDEALEEVVDKVRPTLIVPEAGMSFESEEKAYDMYNDYAGKVGFSIRKSCQKRRVDRTIYRKYIVCSGQGQRENTESTKDTTRTGCDARVQFSVRREGVWPLIQGGYTSLLLGVQQDATLSSSVRKLHFD